MKSKPGPLGSNLTMATDSGGQPPNTNNKFEFRGNDFPDTLANKRPYSMNLDDYCIVNGSRQKFENKFLLISHATENLNLSKTSPFVIQKGLDQITTNLKKH